MYLGNFTSFAVRSTEGSLTRLLKFILVNGEKLMEEKEAKLSGANIMVKEQNRRSFLKLGVTVGTGLALGGISTTADGQTLKEELRG